MPRDIEEHVHWVENEIRNPPSNSVYLARNATYGQANTIHQKAKRLKDREGMRLPSFGHVLSLWPCSWLSQLSPPTTVVPVKPLTDKITSTSVRRTPSIHGSRCSRWPHNLCPPSVQLRCLVLSVSVFRVLDKYAYCFVMADRASTSGRSMSMSMACDQSSDDY